jgi:cytoskeletal protein RodZ
MKKCPFCAEEIQDDAIKCKHCKSNLNSNARHLNVNWEKIKQSGSRSTPRLEVQNDESTIVIKSDDEKPKEGLFLSTLNCGCAIFFIIFVCIIIFISINHGGNQNNNQQPVNQAQIKNNVPVKEDTSSQDKAVAQKELDKIMSLAKQSGLVVSYEFSNSATVVYIGQVWYAQTVQFKKDFIAKIAMLKEQITGYRHLEVRDAYSNEKVAEVTAFAGSLEIYK